jgi:hypothetical protein
MSAPRFHLAVDDGGEHLVLGGDRWQLGHRASKQTEAGVDLGFLAPLRARHGCMERRFSLRGGVQYWLIPDSEAPIEIAGRLPQPGALRLQHSDLVVLGGRLRLRFALLSLDSTSARLTIESCEDCEGARSILLLADGPEGALRIGSRHKHHLRVTDLEHDVTLSLQSAELTVSCAGGFLRGSALGARALSVPLPLQERLWIEPRARAAGKPPFALTLMPSERGS